MQWLRLTALILLGLGLSISGAAAQGDAAEGEKIVRKGCAQCHNVEPNGPFKQFPPSFASIAVYRSVDQIRSRILYPPLHSSMPQLSFIFLPNNVDDIIAYITSLEKK